MGRQQADELFADNVQLDEAMCDGATAEQFRPITLGDVEAKGRRQAHYRPHRSVGVVSRYAVKPPAIRDYDIKQHLVSDTRCLVTTGEAAGRRFVVPWSRRL